MDLAKGAEKNRTKPCRFAGPDQLVHLIGEGETPLRRAVRAERLDGAGQIGQGIGDGNQLTALTLLGFYSPMFPRQDHSVSVHASQRLDLRL